MNAENEFEYASYRKVPQPQYDGSSDYFQHKVKSFVNFDMKTKCPNGPQEKINILQEIYDSERSYVTYLSVVSEIFIPKLAVSGVISNKKLRILFGDILAISQTNQLLLESLRNISVADAFLKLLPYLKLYSTYASQYPNSLKVYADLMSRETFRKIISDIESDSRCQGHKLNALLIMPVQRIPRYILLIEKLMLMSTEPQDMHNLCKAVAEIRKLSENMQLCMATYENGERLLYIQDSFGLDKHVFEPGRILVKEGMLFKREISGSALFQERVFFLFNDVLLYGKKRLTMGVMPLSKYEPSAMMALRHMDVDHNVIEGTIYIKCGEVRLVITADTFELVKEWYDCMSTAIARSKLLRKTLRKESFNKKVMFFDKGFWKRRRDEIRSLVSSEMTNTVERVFSKRKPLAKLDDSDFLSGNWNRTRKRRAAEHLESLSQSVAKKSTTNVNSSTNRQETVFPVYSAFNKVEGTNKIVRKEEEDKEKEVNYNATPMASTVTTKDEKHEGVDEEDRRPRTFGEERKRLAVNEIRKLSYQQHCELEDVFDDQNDSQDYSALQKKTTKTPWWAVESAPPAIANQKLSLIDTVRSNCGIM